MAVNKASSLLENIRNAFKVRDNKEREFKTDVENLETEVREITKRMGEISYTALVENDAMAFKEYETLKRNEEKKIADLELAKERLKALDKFELGIDTEAEALKIYKGIEKEIDLKSKELGKKTTEYYNALVELRNRAEEIKKLENEIKQLPNGLAEVVDWLNPEDIGKGEESLRPFKESIRNPGGGMYLFDADIYKYRDKKLTDSDMRLYRNGSADIRP